MQKNKTDSLLGSAAGKSGDGSAPIAEARALLAEITPGNWTYDVRLEKVQTDHPGEGSICDVGDDWMRDADGHFIAAAPRLMRALLDALSRARREPKPCVGCGQSFTPTDGRQKYCTPKCAGRDRLRRFNERKQLAVPQVDTAVSPSTVVDDSQSGAKDFWCLECHCTVDQWHRCGWADGRF